MIIESRSIVHHNVLAWIKSETAKGRHELGFLPDRAFAKYHHQGDILCRLENDDLVAFLASEQTSMCRNIYALWTREDARRQLFASELLCELCDRAEIENAHHIGLWCASDIEGFHFWRSHGFVVTDWRYGSAKHDRYHARMTFRVKPRSQGLLQLDLEPILPVSRESISFARSPNSSAAHVGRKAGRVQRDNAPRLFDPSDE